MIVEVFGITKLRQKLQRAVAQMGQWDEEFRGPLFSIASLGIQRNFDSQGASLGMPWQPSRRAAREGGLTLVDEGTLRMSAANPGNILFRIAPTTVDGDRAITMTLVPPMNLDYGPDLHVGRDPMPARPWFQVPEVEVRPMRDLVEFQILPRKFRGLFQ